MKFRFFIPLITIGILVAFFMRGLFLDPTEVPSPLIGKAAPAFILPTLHDPGQSFSSDRFKGQASLLNVFGTWCPGCHTEHALLVELSRTLDVPIYGFNWKDDRSKCIQWLESTGNPYTEIAFDQEGDVAIDYGVYGAPETFVIDANGVIRYKHIGVLTPEVVRDRILPLLETLRKEDRMVTPDTTGADT